MNAHQLALNLAGSLAGGPWSETWIDAALRRRLPTTLAPCAPELAEHLCTECRTSYAPSAQVIARSLRAAPAFDRVRRYCRQHGVWPDPDLSAPLMAPTAPFARLDLPRMITTEDLAQWLALSQGRLRYFADPSGRFEEHGDAAVNHYHYHLRSKRSGGVRLIEAPKQSLKAMQRHILRRILDRVPPHPNAFGFVQDRDCLTGAACHAAEEVVICFDLRDFFPSINAGRVFGLFRCLGYPHAVAHQLTGLCTTITPSRVLDRMPTQSRAMFRQRHLPQGAPTSPALSNQIAYAVDVRLSALADRIGARYSRYADDLAFSGDRYIAATVLRCVPEIVQDAGFAINPRKTRLMSAACRQVVTGLVVNAHLNTTRADFDQLKAVIHACGKPGDMRLQDPAFRASLLGQIGWVERVNPARGAKLRQRLARALAQRTA